jgi:hypothetical protein
VKSPVPEALRTEWRTIASLVRLNAGYAVGFYLCFVYATTYLRKTDHLSASKALAGVSPAAMVELVPDRLRCTVLCVGFNLGFGIFGGLTPMVAVYTINRSHEDLSPAFLLMAAAAVSSIVIAGLRETYKLALAPGWRNSSRSSRRGRLVLQIKRLVPWARRATLDPNRSLVAGNRDGEKCSRAVIESGTVFAGSCRSLARFGCQRCAKRDVTGHIIMADGSYRTV